MKPNALTKLSLSLALAVSAFAAAPAVFAETHDHSAMMKMDAASTPAAFDLAQAVAAYPLDTCVVSGDKLKGEMGGPIDYIHKEAGQPDRLVRFCCKDCVKDFKKDPAKYLKKIDDALATKGEHAGHMH